MNKLNGNNLSQNGFSLIQMLASLAIISILFVFAIPSVNAFINHSSIDVTRESLLQDIRLLRNEALAQRKPVTLCGLDAAGGCNHSRLWDKGWIGFTDQNTNRQIDAGEQLIVRHDISMNGKPHVILRSMRTYQRISSLGLLRFTGNFRICDPDFPNQHVMVIRMNNYGRFDSENNTETCSLRN